jgi:hypothetical protein
MVSFIAASSSSLKTLSDVLADLLRFVDRFVSGMSVRPFTRRLAATTGLAVCARSTQTLPIRPAIRFSDAARSPRDDARIATTAHRGALLRRDRCRCLPLIGS